MGLQRACSKRQVRPPGACPTLGRARSRGQSGPKLETMFGQRLLSLAANCSCRPIPDVGAAEERSVERFIVRQLAVVEKDLVCTFNQVQNTLWATALKTSNRSTTRRIGPPPPLATGRGEPFAAGSFYF